MSCRTHCRYFLQAGYSVIFLHRRYTPSVSPFVSLAVVLHPSCIVCHAKPHLSLASNKAEFLIAVSIPPFLVLSWLWSRGSVRPFCRGLPESPLLSCLEVQAAIPSQTAPTEQPQPTEHLSGASPTFPLHFRPAVSLPSGSCFFPCYTRPKEAKSNGSTLQLALHFRAGSDPELLAPWLLFSFNCSSQRSQNAVPRSHPSSSQAEPGGRWPVLYDLAMSSHH